MILGKYAVELMSNATGEVVLTIGEMIRTIWFDRIHLHFWNLSWKLHIADLSSLPLSDGEDLPF